MECTVRSHEEHDGRPLRLLGGEARFFEPLDITDLAKQLIEKGERVFVTPAQIIAGRDGEMHRHVGATIEFGVIGRGFVKTPGGNLALGPRDVAIIPPEAPHVAVRGETGPLVLFAVYIGPEGDRQAFMQD